MVDNRNIFWGFIEKDARLNQWLQTVVDIVREKPSFYDECYNAIVHELLGIIIVITIEDNSDNNIWVTPVCNLLKMSKPKRPLEIKQSPPFGRKYVIEDFANGCKRYYLKNIEINEQLSICRDSKGISFRDPELEQLYQGNIIHQSLHNKCEYNMFVTRDELLSVFPQ